MTRCASLRRSSRLHHLRCCSMSPILDVLRCLLVTSSHSPPLNHFYFVDVRFEVGIPYRTDILRDGLTNDLYVCSLTEVEPMFRLRRRKPRVLLALPQMLLMWLSHLRSSLIVTPRYFALSTDSKA